MRPIIIVVNFVYIKNQKKDDDKLINNIDTIREQNY